MKIMKRRLLAMLVAVSIVLSLVPAMSLTAFAVQDPITQREYVVSMIKSAGMKDSMFGTENDQDALAKSLGFLDNWNYNPTGEVTAEVAVGMDAAMSGALNGLRTALAKQPLEPYFVNGMAQPIFPYGNSIYNDTSGEGVIRFVVYVESDYDTDADGKLDLVKTLVQLPRAALSGSKFSTIYEARPYIEGTNGQSIAAAVQNAGTNYLADNPELSHADLYKVVPPRVPAGSTNTTALAASAQYTDWYYRYSGGSSSATITAGNGTNENNFEDLNWYDYYLVRGFAVVLSAGIGSAGSEGYSTCGSDVEIAAFRSVIEWMTGDRKAYSDKTSNTEIKADWSNGNIGMTGRSYAATTQFGLATTGVKGLKTIVPVAGIASWYEYTNGQGVAISNAYTTGLAWHCNSRLASPEWAAVLNRYAGYSQLMRAEENALLGDYGPHWARRDYTIDNWFKDWGPGSIQTPMLIVHGANDDNVRPKQSVLMYQAAQKAGVPVKVMWHQGHHMTPTFPSASPNATDSSRPYSMYCGDYLYDEWLNLWFSNYLYNQDNGIMDLMPNVLALDNRSGEWVSYDSWESAKSIILDQSNLISPTAPAPRMRRIYEEPEDYTEKFPIPDAAAQTNAVASGTTAAIAAAVVTEDEDFTVINSANGSSSWQNFLDAPTAASTVYSLVLPEDVTVKGVTQVNIRAAITSLGNNAGIDNNPLRMHARLVEVAQPGTTLKYYGSNAMGASIGVTMLKQGGSWQGGGITSHNLVQFNQASTGSYRELGKGWMDLRNPQAGYASSTATIANTINPRENLGVYHDYTLFLQPTLHTATEGNRLVLIITTGASNSAAYTGNNAYTFTIDNTKTNVIIPIAGEADTSNLQLTTDAIDVMAGDQFAVTASYKNPVKSNTAILDFTFDKAKFEVVDFAEAAGVTVLTSVETADGIRLTVMVNDYNTSVYGDLILKAKDDVELEDEENEVVLRVNYVLLHEDGTKEIVQDAASTVFDTVSDFGELVYDLLTLSDMIDAFGTKRGDPGWPDCRQFDLNRNGEIDILDISQFASKISG